MLVLVLQQVSFRVGFAIVRYFSVYVATDKVGNGQRVSVSLRSVPWKPSLGKL